MQGYDPRAAFARLRPDAAEAADPACPFCGRRAERFYTDLSGGVLGCEYCVCPALWYELPRGADGAQARALRAGRFFTGKA